MPRQPLLVGAALIGWVVACMLAPEPLARGAAYAMLVLGALAGALIAATTLSEARRHVRLIAGIDRLSRPGVLGGHAVSVVPGLGAALVGGLRSPRIYCGDDLRWRLDEEELRAVIVHERYHQIERAPLRLLLINTLAPFLSRLEAGRIWMERERARLEIAADAFALRLGASRPALASALVKLSSGPRLATMPGFESAAELRIRALLGDGAGFPAARDSPTGRTIAGLVALVACLVVYIA